MKAIRTRATQPLSTEDVLTCLDHYDDGAAAPGSDNAIALLRLIVGTHGGRGLPMVETLAVIAHPSALKRLAADGLIEGVQYDGSDAMFMRAHPSVRTALARLDRAEQVIA